MGRLIINTAVTVNGAFDSPAPDMWLEVDDDCGDDGLDLLMLGEALLLGRKTYEGLSVVWPNLAEDPELSRFAGRINAMPKYVASRTLSGPLEWNSTLLEERVGRSVVSGVHPSTLLLLGRCVGFELDEVALDSSPGTVGGDWNQDDGHRSGHLGRDERFEPAGRYLQTGPGGDPEGALPGSVDSDVAPVGVQCQRPGGLRHDAQSFGEAALCPPSVSR